MPFERSPNGPNTTHLFTSTAFAPLLVSCCGNDGDGAIEIVSPLTLAQSKIPSGRRRSRPLREVSSSPDNNGPACTATPLTEGHVGHSALSLDSWLLLERLDRGSCRNTDVLVEADRWEESR